VNEAEVLKLLSQSGLTGVALFVIGRIFWRVGERLIAAIDRIGVKIDDHTERDTRAVGELRQDIAVLSTRVDTAIDYQERTPIGGPPVPDPPKRAASHGFYSLKKER